jgi:protein arginine N-methyltransferase 5
MMIAAPQPWTLTGLLGTFTAELYRSSGEESVFISTAPSTFSLGMFSWFPLYFPLKEPVHVPAGASVQVTLWRKVVQARVWYEWTVTVHRNGEVLYVSPIHNPAGRSYHVSL